MRTNVLATTIFAFVAFAHSTTAADSEPSLAPPDKLAAHFIQESASLSRLLSDLAAERQKTVSADGSVWIFTVHVGSGIRKFTDGKHTVVSLPILEPADSTALCRYVTGCNSFTLKAADLQVLGGKYKEAKATYALLAHFDCPGGPFRDYVEQRLPLVSNLEKGVEAEKTTSEFKQLYSDYFSFVDYSRIHTATPTVVSNLLSLPPPPASMNK